MRGVQRHPQDPLHWGNGLQSSSHSRAGWQTAYIRVWRILLTQPYSGGTPLGDPRGRDRETTPNTDKTVWAWREPTQSDMARRRPIKRSRRSLRTDSKFLATVASCDRFWGTPKGQPHGRIPTRRKTPRHHTKRKIIHIHWGWRYHTRRWGHRHL